MSKKKKKGRVPEVLWRVFRYRARTLSNTVTSLINNPPSSFVLFKADDPATYRKLLKDCYIVLSDNAPPVAHFNLENRWPQPLIVSRIIEFIIAEQPLSNNVLCSGYDKCLRSSPIAEVLTSSAWALLLERVGDEFMDYLLKYSSMFVPLPRQQHQQVAGSPITGFVFQSSRRKGHSPKLVGLKRKRDWDDKAADAASLMLKRHQLTADASLSYDRRTYPVVDFDQDRGLSEKTGVAAVNRDGHSNEKLPGLYQCTLRSRKPFGWQRRRFKKQRSLDAKETDGKPYYIMNEGSSPDRRPLEFRNSSSPKKMLPQCCCHLVFQAPNMKGVQIDRRSIFYNSKHPSSMLPKNHVLMCLKPNLIGSKSLIRSIFGLSDEDVIATSMPLSYSKDFCLLGSTCLYHSLAKLLKLLVRQTQCCKYARLMHRHCFISSSNQHAIENSNSVVEGYNLEREFSGKSRAVANELCDKTLETTDPQIVTLKSYCSKSQVVSFIWAVCRNVVPSELLGNHVNRRILRRNIAKFIWLRKFEKFSLKQCMHKLKTSGFPFLSDKHFSCCLDTHMLNNMPGHTAGLHKDLYKWNGAANDLKHLLVQKWIYWFFSSLVVPLVQANFYVTESEHGKHEIYYYRKSIWEKLRNRAISCLKDQNYQCLDEASAESITGCRLFGFSKLRLLPKKNGIRMIANLKASSTMPAKTSTSELQSFRMQKKTQSVTKVVKREHFKPVNCVLRDTHAVLKGIQLNEPDKLGSSVFDYNDIYRKLCQFKICLNKRSNIMPDVFIVVSDVSKAFDSIDQDKLLCVMEDVMYEDQYLLKRFCQVISTKKSLWVREHLMPRDQNITTGLTRFSSSLRFGSLHTVLVNQGRGRYLKREQLLFNLTEHVKRNVLQFDDKFYLQRKGIPQGSILSSLLCSLYYGHLERNVIFPFLEDLSRHCYQDASAIGSSSRDKVVSSPHYMLLRFIDDFLFISTSKKQAAGLFSQLRSGFRDYNCFMNEEKFCLNLDTEQVSGLQSNKLYVGEDGISFLRWSGLLLNSCTLEVQADYTRYLNNHLNSTLTVCWQGKPRQHLERKLWNFMRPKCHPIFFDSHINSAPVVRLNIYQAFLLCAMKFHCYVSSMSFHCHLSATFYSNMIEGSFRYMYDLIKRRMRSMHLGSCFHPILQLEVREVKWLGLNAYIQVLKRKQSRYKELLSRLSSKLSKHRAGGSTSPHLKYAVDSSHSSLLWKIK
uniref:Telomerase reverse transcriptase n=1 Tax=Salix viminalis TaxID=40686 RepID=A0A6N2KEM2_SALVM